MPYCRNCGSWVDQSGQCPNCNHYANSAPFIGHNVPHNSRQMPQEQYYVPTKKKKNIGLLITVICLAVMLLAMSGYMAYHFLFDSADNKKTEKEQSSQGEKKEEEETEGPELSDDWQDMSFEVDGVVYQLPCSLQTLLNHDWVVDEESYETEEDLIDGKTGTLLLMKKDYYATAYVYNSKKDEQQIKDCEVIALCYMIEDGTVFGGTELDDINSTEDIIDLFGEPDYYSEYGGCVYESNGVIMEVCYDESGWAELSYYTKQAVKLGYVPKKSEKSASAEIKGDFKDQTLTVWTAYREGTPTWEVANAYIARFEEQTGATIDVKHLGTDLQTMLYPALDAGEDIDVFVVGSTIQLNLQKDHALDLTPYVVDSDILDRAYPIHMENIKSVSGGKYLAIPSNSSFSSFWYNKDIFRAAGVTKPPETIAEFEAACDKIVAAGYYPMALDSAYAVSTFGALVERTVGEKVVGEMTLNGGFADNERFVAACQRIIDWKAKGYFEPDAPGVWPGSQSRIGLMKDTAMVYTGLWLPGEVEEMTASVLDWGCFKFPYDPSCADGTYGASVSCSCNMINKNTDTPDLAWEFMYYMNTGVVNQDLTNAEDYLVDDRTMEPLPRFEGAKEIMETTTEVVNYAGGLHDNVDIKTSISEIATNLYEGRYTTGLQAAQAFDAIVR